MDYTIRSFFLYFQGIHDIFPSRIFVHFFHSTFGPRASKNSCSNKSSNKTCKAFIFLPLFIPIDCRLSLLFQKNFFEKISVKITFLLCKLKNIAIPIYYPSLYICPSKKIYPTKKQSRSTRLFFIFTFQVPFF